MTGNSASESELQGRKLSLPTKLAFGAGDMGAGITATLLAFSFLIFLTNVAHLRPALAGTVLLIGKIWDAINDPIVGFLSDRTRSRWGRRHTWMIWGGIPFGVFFFLHWLVPGWASPDPANQWGLFWYYVVVSILFNTAYTAVNLPYTALTPELTQNYNERTSLTGYRFVFSIGGSLLSLALGVVLAGSIDNPQQQYLWLGGICAILAVLPLYWCIWGTTDRTAYDPNRPETAEGAESGTETSLSLQQQLKIAFSNRPFLFVIGIYLCSWLAFQLTAAVIPYYAIGWMGLESYFMVALVVQGVAMVALLVWSAISRRYGRKAAYFSGMILWIVAQGGLFFLPRDRVDILYFLCAMAGLGVATAYLIPWSMLTDVTDLDELQSGHRREGVFYAFMVLLQKIGLALGLFLVGQMLELAGFVESTPGQPLPPQPDSALLAIRLAIGPLPTALLIIGSILAYFYPLTREVHEEILLKLQERQKTVDS
ncbi:MFS transporter [Baaleninema sp.]|uniref:MFS transporter n=1 Tax=Baaleninema sp. TaxID=3101197 RepID=UPI003D087196